MNAPLYLIDNELFAILAGSESGELTDEQSARLDELSMARNDKIDAILRYRRVCETRAIGLQAEIDRLQAAKRREDESSEWLKKYVYESMLRNGEKAFATTLFKGRIQRNSQPSVTLTVDPKELPEKFQRVKTIIKADKTALAQAAKDGEQLPRGVSVETGSHLRIS
jgi:hypothetical protein